MYIKNAEYFLIIAKEGNLSKAAEKLFISQPAISKFLNNLESDYGTKLFERNKNKLEMTPAGRAYYEAAQQIHNISINLDRSIDNLKQDGRHNLSIGVTGERTHKFLGLILQDMYKKYKDLHIHVLEYPVPELISMIKNGDVDFGIFAAYNVSDELDSVHIKEEEIVLAVPVTHKLAEKGSFDAHQSTYKVDLTTLKDESFLLLKKGTTLRHIEDKYFNQIGFFPKEVIATNGSLSNLLYVENNLGIGFSPMDFKFTSDKVKYLRLKQPFYYSCSLFYKKGLIVSDVMKDFIATTQKYKDSL